LRHYFRPVVVVVRHKTEHLEGLELRQLLLEVQSFMVVVVVVVLAMSMELIPPVVLVVVVVVVLVRNRMVVMERAD
jgi:hypothetical protein